MRLVPLARFMAGRSFLPLSLYLNELLKRSLGIDEVVSLGFDAGAVVLIFGYFEAVIGFVGGEHPFGRLIFGVSFDALFITIF